jgi:hypothetical protein
VWRTFLAKVKVYRRADCVTWLVDLNRFSGALSTCHLHQIAPGWPHMYDGQVKLLYFFARTAS